MNSVKVSSNVIDEMFPEGPETMMMELDEVNLAMKHQFALK